MNSRALRLEISTAPYLHQQLSTQRVMLEVIAALIPVVAAAVYYFGVGALLVIIACCAGAMGTEWLVSSGGRKGIGTLRDNTALLTGILLALTLPPSIPLWMAFLGGVMGIGLGKLIFGGLGKNFFNPALVGRAFLQAAFPTAITTWTAPTERISEVIPNTLAWPFMRSGVDVISTATPLALQKFQNQITELAPLLKGNTAGSLGETAGIIIIICGLILGIRKVFDWRLPVATLLSVALFSGILHFLVDNSAYPHPAFMLCSGGLLFGAVYMVTDPVTTPISPKGAWVYGFGVGILVVLIRLFGGLPEGVMYAILLMNAVSPLIDRYTQPRPFGG